MSGERKPAAPAGLGREATRLWRNLLGTYELGPGELPLARELVRVVDRLEELAAVVAAEGAMAPDGSGRVHPAVTESRQQQLTLAKLTTALRLPDESDTGDAGALSNSMRTVAEARWRGRRGA